jgi:diguanylate cyclase (GGDEF)-like protein
MALEPITTDLPRYEQSNADVLLWQTRYRVGLALLAVIGALLLRQLAGFAPSPVAVAQLGDMGVASLIGIAVALYIAVVLSLHRHVQRTRRASRALASLMMVGDLLLVFILVFALAPPRSYDRALLVALFALQLTHVYFGRGPALLMLAATGRGYLLLVDLASSSGAMGIVVVKCGHHARPSSPVVPISSRWCRVTCTNASRRLLDMFARAEDGDFTSSYDVAADRGRTPSRTWGGRTTACERTCRHRGDRPAQRLPQSSRLRAAAQVVNFRGPRVRRPSSRSSYIDLDHFKQVNDTYGHLTGDQVITEAGELLRANARADDIVARTGGEEFAILAPGSGFAGAQHLALRIVEAFRRRTFGEPKARVMVTVSIGVVADAVADDGIAEALRARADEALYAAKRSGRNRVVVWTPGLAALRAAAGEPAIR